MLVFLKLYLYTKRIGKLILPTVIVELHIMIFIRCRRHGNKSNTLTNKTRMAPPKFILSTIHMTYDIFFISSTDSSRITWFDLWYEKRRRFITFFLMGMQTDLAKIYLVVCYMPLEMPPLFFLFITSYNVLEMDRNSMPSFSLVEDIRWYCSIIKYMVGHKRQ